MSIGKQTKDLILLNMLEDVGCIRLKALLDEFKTPEAILHAPIDRLKKLKGIGEKTAESIIDGRSSCDIDKEIDFIEKHKIRIITIFDDDYPNILKNIYDPPILLYVKGDLAGIDNFTLAIVGSRRCSHYGLKTAERFGNELAKAGAIVVSGMARGIDTSAHKGALNAGGKTIAVLGNGLGSIYPPENRSLSEKIAENGLLISEFPFDTPPHKQNFPRRNRIISGLSNGVVVIEAAEKSGALITANFALEHNREVFAVPGHANSISSSGTNNLIKQGAKLVEGAKDILEEFRAYEEQAKSNARVPKFNSSLEKDIYEVISDEPSNIDIIMSKMTVDPKALKRSLLELEMNGLIQHLPGRLYVRT